MLMEPSHTHHRQGYSCGLHRGHDVGLDEELGWRAEESGQYANGHVDGYHAVLMAKAGREMN